jgi:hypothetical protein
VAVAEGIVGPGVSRAGEVGWEALRPLADGGESQAAKRRRKGVSNSEF